MSIQITENHLENKIVPVYLIKNERVMTTMEDKKPFIHLFRTSQDYYMYDVNRDQIVRLPEIVYLDLKKDVSSNGNTEESRDQIENLKRHGFLKTNRVQEVEHPRSEILPFLLENSMSQLILQVTQKCNLKCHYCVYSGGYANREHSQKDMSFAIAKTAIDYFIAHSRDSSSFTVSFYGGEPLLAIDLIKECISYCKKQMEGKPVAFNLTTNGTLLTGATMDYLVGENVALMFSLDGPQQIHDRNRRFANNDRGSYDIVMKHIAELKERYPKYYATHVTFNAVMDTKNGFKEFNDFVMESDLFRNLYFSTSSVSSRYAEVAVDSATEQFDVEWSYELFKLYLSKLGKLNSATTSNIVKAQFRSMCQKCLGKKTEYVDGLPQKWHHSGPCMPGVLRLFVNAEGKFFPCERVSEKSEIACMGDIYRGIDLGKADTILNIERATHTKCEDCWCYRFCNICICAVDGLVHLDGNLANRECVTLKASVENLLADYCTLTDCGYTFLEEQLDKTLLI